MQIGLSEAAILARKIASFGDPRLYALALAAEHLSKSTQPLVPERVFLTGGSTDGKDGHAGGGVQGMLGTLIGLLVAEKSGFANNANTTEMAEVRDLVDRITRQAVNSMGQPVEATPAAAPTDGTKEVAKTA
jgi:hypothetical protein